MIKSKKELKFYMAADMMMNKGTFERSIKICIRDILYSDYTIRFLRLMRKVDYYSNDTSLWGGVLRVWYSTLYKSMSLRMGFYIGPQCFGYGLVIPHPGTIVVGESNRIGNYAVLNTSTCISGNGKVIGDALYLAAGAMITSKVVLGDNISIGANSVVNKDFKDGNVMIAGAPARIIKNSEPWYIRDGETFYNRVKAVEDLKFLLKI